MTIFRKYFYLDNIKGSVDMDGFITWSNIHCHLHSLKDSSELKKVVLKVI